MINVMKNLSKLALAGIFCITTLTASAIVVPSYRVVGPHKALQPILLDSVNSTGKSYDISNLLNLKLKASATSGVAKSDEQGVLMLTKGDVTSLYALQTNLRSGRYVKGKLKVTSPSRFEVFVNGGSKIKKTVADTAGAELRPMEASIELWPEDMASIDIKLLSHSADAQAPQVKVEFVPEADFSDVALGAGVDIKGRVTLATTEEGPRASGVAISPDGKYLLTYFRNQIAHNNIQYRTELSEISTGKVLDANMQRMEWMPTGSRLYYLQQTADGYDLFVYNPSTGVTSKFASALPVNRIIWSPDEKYVVYYDTDKGLQDPGPLRRIQNPDDRIKGNRDHYYLKKYDFSTGMESVLTYGAINTYLQDISPDGKKILISVSRPNFTKWPFHEVSLLQMDAATLVVDTLLNNEVTFSTANYSPDGKRLFITAGPAFHGGIGQNCGEHKIANEYDVQGFLMDIAGRKIEPISRDFNPSIDGPVSWNKADGNIYMRVTEGLDVNVYCYNPNKKTYRKLPTEVASTLQFSIGSYDSRWMAYTGQGNDYAGRAYMLNLKNGQSRLLADPYAETLDKIEFGAEEQWVFKNSKGDNIDGFFIYPPAFDEAKKYPMIVYYYGGTSPSQRGFYSPYSAQLFASRGYVVYVLNPSGTTGYGQEFSARHVNAWGKQTADDIIEGVKAFCAAHPFVDSKKVGCIGASYGGFMTQYLLTQTDIFAAGVSHAGISNVTSYWGEGWWGYSYNSVAAAQSYPWTNPELFTKQGSLFNADKIHTPLLLLHGTADTNVPIGESIQLFNALRLLGRTVEFITVDKQDHFVLDHPHKRLWSATMMAWFAKWLQDDPRWWDSMYGNK